MRIETDNANACVRRESKLQPQAATLSEALNLEGSEPAIREAIGRLMRWNPYTDPFVERGYFGYSLHGIAHRIEAKCFVPRLEIRDSASGENEFLYDRTFAEIFADADEAIRRAMSKGEQIIDNRLEHLNRGETADLVH